MEKLNRRSIVGFAGACLLGALTSVTQAQDTFNWKMFTALGTSDVGTQLHRGFIEDLDKASNGRLKITLYTAGELPYKATDVLRATATRQVDMAHIAGGFMSGDLPQLNAFSIPFSCTSLQAFYDKAAPAIAPIVDPVMSEKFGVTPLIHWSNPAQQIFSRTPIEGLDSLKGLKMRAWNREQVQTMEILGGSGVSITPAEVIPALQRGVVDGAFTAYVTAVAWKIQDVVKYGYAINFTLSHELVVINDAALAELPEDLRTLVNNKAKEWSTQYRDKVIDASEKARTTLTDAGMTITDADQPTLDKLREVTAPIGDDWVKANGEIAEKLLATVRQSCS